jgi:nitroreductase
MTNSVLDAIENRRSIVRFETTPIEEEKIQAILEAGRWAPSWLNKQPWRFIVVTDPAIKESLSEFVPTVFKLGVREAPVCIVVSVDPNEDSFHFIEDGAAATQNMALAAQSLGLGSCWIGTFAFKKEKKSSEEKIRDVLEIPKIHRVVSLLPIGIPKKAGEKDRKELSQLVYRNKFGQSKL